MLLLINLMSSKRWFLTRKIRKSNMVFIQALMAVARAIPISRILLINMFYLWPLGRGGAQQRMTLLYESLSELGDVEIGVLVSSSALANAKKHSMLFTAKPSKTFTFLS